MVGHLKSHYVSMTQAPMKPQNWIPAPWFSSSVNLTLNMNSLPFIEAPVSLSHPTSQILESSVSFNFLSVNMCLGFFFFNIFSVIVCDGVSKVWSSLSPKAVWLESNFRGACVLQFSSGYNLTLLLQKCAESQNLEPVWTTEMFSWVSGRHKFTSFVLKCLPTFN